MVSPAASAAGSVSLPAGLRVLGIGGRGTDWTSLVLRLDAAGCTQLQFRWMPGAAEAIAYIHDAPIDLLLILADTGDPLETPEDAAATALLAALRTGGLQEPVVLLTGVPSDPLALAACTHRAELLVSKRRLDSPALLPVIANALARGELVRENQRLDTADRRRQNRERDEAERLLHHQREILEGLELGPLSLRAEAAAADPAAGAPGVSPPPGLPAELAGSYQELLRAYVIMGSGSLGAEIERFTEVLAALDCAPRDALRMHLAELDQLLQGLGRRSSRHVLARADLLALELMIRLGEHHQRSARPRSLPPLSTARDVA